MSLRQKLVSAIGWSVGIKLAVQIIVWAMTLMVIRIISPDDYGLMAITQVFINFMLGFASLGLGDALIQRTETSKDIVARVFGVQIMIALALMALLCLAAYPIAHWYHDPRLVPLIQVSSIGYLFYAFAALPRAFLTKHMRVRPIFIVEAGSGLAGAAAVILLAFHDYGVWALMLGTMAGHLARLILYVVVASEFYVWPKFDLAGIGPLFSFGIFRTLEYTVWMIFVSADIFIVSSILGATAVGVYVVASNFATMPLSKIAPIINTTIFPAFALVQDQPAEARFYAMKGMRIMAVATVPVFFGICAVAPEIVDLIFGPNWLAAKSVLGILALATSFRAILLIVPNFLQGIGDSRGGFWCTATGAAIFPPAFLIGCQWGVVGVACGWLFGYFAVFALHAVIAARRGGLDVREMLLLPIPPMAAGIVMILAVTAVRRLLPPGMPETLSLLMLIATGAAVYGATVFLLFRDLAMEMIGMVYRSPSPAT